MNPVVFLVPVGREAQLPENRRVFRLALVPGQHHGGDGITVFFGDGFRRSHIRRELFHRLPFFPAIVVGKSVAANLLSRDFGNQIDQGRGEKAGRLLLIFPDLGKFFIGPQRRIVISGPPGSIREKGGSLPAVFRKQKANGCPGGVNAVFFKQLQKLRDGLSAAQNMILIRFQGADIQHAPKQLKIQRYNQRTGHGDASFRH